MKGIKSLLLMLCMTSLLACEKEDNNNQNINSEELVSIYEGNKIIGYADASEFTIPTNDELKTFYKKGWLSLDEVQSRSNTCRWSDGVGGSVDCDGGECRVVWYRNSKTKTTRAGLGCFINGEIDHAGAFRNEK